jgi:hypothetical protein
MNEEECATPADSASSGSREGILRLLGQFPESATIMAKLGFAERFVLQHDWNTGTAKV